jgi:succinate-semialdehyde dehydrogenase/glutarate-semialdehyde dehydrogenase
MKLNDPSLLVERCYVGGDWIGEPSVPIDNPATGEVIARVPRLGAAEATDAIERRRRRSRPGRARPPGSVPPFCAAGST